VGGGGGFVARPSEQAYIFGFKGKAGGGCERVIAGAAAALESSSFSGCCCCMNSLAGGLTASLICNAAPADCGISQLGLIWAVEDCNAGFSSADAGNSSAVRLSPTSDEAAPPPGGTRLVYVPVPVPVPSNDTQFAAAPVSCSQGREGRQLRSCCGSSVTN
jgi:hypothetical protein